MSTAARAFGAALCAATALTGAALAGAHEGRAHFAAGPVPARTGATSITFVSPDDAFVLGTAPCAHKPCSVILRTTDRGASWVGMPAPVERVSYVDGDGLWGVRFADRHRGFAFGRGLWATTDGAQSWHRITPPAKFVLALEAVADHRLVAIASDCGDNETCAPAFALFTRALSGGSWVRIAGSSTSGLGSISVHGASVWALLGTKLLVSGNGGASFAARALPRGVCSKLGATGMADDGAHAYLLCIGSAFTGHTLKYVYRTTGSGWKLVGRPPAAGDGGTLAAGSDETVTIATASAASWLYSSRDGGRHWRNPLFIGDGGQGWGDLGFTNAHDGVVIHGPAQTDGGSSRFAGRVLLTDDGGRSWHAVKF